MWLLLYNFVRCQEVTYFHAGKPKSRMSVLAKRTSFYPLLPLPSSLDVHFPSSHKPAHSTNKMPRPFQAPLPGNFSRQFVAKPLAAPLAVPMPMPPPKAENSTDLCRLQEQSNAVRCEPPAAQVMNPVETNALKPRRTPTTSVQNPSIQPTSTSGVNCTRCSFQMKFCPCCGLPLNSDPQASSSTEESEIPPPPSAFTLFKEKTLQSDASVAALGRKEQIQLLAKRWSLLPNEERESFESQSLALRQAHAAARKTQRSKDEPVEAEPKPKRVYTKSAYMHFQDAKRAEVIAQVRSAIPTDMQASEVHKFVFRETAAKLSALWKSLTEEERESFRAPNPSSVPATRENSAANPDDSELPPSVSVGAPSLAHEAPNPSLGGSDETHIETLVGPTATLNPVSDDSVENNAAADS
jgi:hypothetical protein